MTTMRMLHNTNNLKMKVTTRFEADKKKKEQIDTAAHKESILLYNSLITSQGSLLVVEILNTFCF